ncbi:uncharacterized protein TNCV_1256991 [Trichonephila clavipes]|nr:uncharacterized protein TNCV_1256991 [Trichonephila clavipes]
MTKLSCKKISEKGNLLDKEGPEIITGKTICKKICCFVIAFALFALFSALLICLVPPNGNCFCTREILVNDPLSVSNYQKSIRNAIKLHKLMDYIKNYRLSYVYGRKIEDVNKIVKLWEDTPQAIYAMIFVAAIFATASVFTFKFPNAAKNSFNSEMCVKT